MSDFKGTWQYAKNKAMGKDVVPDMAAITVEDDANGDPAGINFPGLNLSVETKGSHDISFKRDTDYRGRLVILSANTPAILIGSVARGDYSDRNPQNPVGDVDVDVFIAVKTS